MAMFIVRRVKVQHLRPTKENDQRFFSSLEERIKAEFLNKKLLRSLATHDHTIISCTMVIASGGSHRSNVRDFRLCLIIIPKESPILRGIRC
nr:MAG TPA: hypothetical protein [Caudoviricetes sp.]